MTNDDFKQAALEYHRLSPPGKIKVAPTKPMLTQRDLALALLGGVAGAAGLDLFTHKAFLKVCRWAT